MTKRSVIAVVLLTVLTCGIYGLYWLLRTKDEMVARGAEIPTGWLLIIPLAHFYWQWRWAEGVERVTRGRMSAVIAFVMTLLGPIGMALVQATFNESSDDESAWLPEARVV
jgi:hypothetical protein